MTDTIRTPQRTCIGCRSRRPQAALLRVVIGPDGSALVSRTAPGRGAWLCNPPEPCLELAKKRRGFERAFRAAFDEGALDGLMSAARETTENEGDAESQRASDEAPVRQPAAGSRPQTAYAAGERNERPAWPERN